MNVTDWRTLQFAHHWPFAVLLVTFALLILRWWFDQRYSFPDIRLITTTHSTPGTIEAITVATGIVALTLFTLVLTEPSVVQIKKAEQRARDFLVVVDTSRSMRHDTAVRRDEFDTHFERKVGAFASMVEDPQMMPYVARYELARESLLGFLERRGAEDRVGLIYFNDDAHPVSALTPNISFVVEQLASMDQYVNWGTDIAAAMESALNLLDRYDDHNKRALILLTDAETRFTNDIEDQLERITKSGLSFYLLWISADELQGSDDAVRSFLARAGSVGTVFSINDLSSDSLQQIFTDIGQMESYQYQEQRRQTLQLAAPLWQASRVMFLFWFMAMVTIFHTPISAHRRPESIA